MSRMSVIVYGNPWLVMSGVLSSYIVKYCRSCFENSQASGSVCNGLVHISMYILTARY